MAEYNFWDDRTWDTCDENWCSIVNDYCLNAKYDVLPSCSYCKDMIDYMKFIEKDEKSKMWTTKDIAYYVTHHCESDCYCKWAGCWNCISSIMNPKFHPQCHVMLQIAFDMILDHLY